MTILAPNPTFSLEELHRHFVYVLYDGLNDVLADVEARMQAKDQEFATRLGRDYVETTLEPIAPENFYEGHRPSITKAPMTAFPNVAAMAFRAVPAPGNDQLDQMSVYRDQIFVDVLVKTEKSGDEGEEEINRRIHRTVEAANICVMRNPTLEGIVFGLDTAPSVAVSDVFTRKEQAAYGPEWLWQGARLDYAVRKEAADPTPSGSPFRAGLDIDQG